MASRSTSRARADSKQPELNGSDEVAARATEGMLGPNPFVGVRSQDLLEQFQKIAEQAALHPWLVLAQQMELVRNFTAILSGNSDLAPSPDDKRFRDADWSENGLCRICLQGYLAWARGLDELVGKLGLRDKDTQRARFAVSLVTDAFAPSNILSQLVGAAAAGVLHGARTVDLLDTTWSQEL